MSIEATFTNALADRVVDLVESKRCMSEVEALPLVRVWVSQVSEQHRPTPQAVLMTAKRRIWNLKSI